MPLDVIMPALGMAQETGQIVAWHKQPGDAVAKGDILFEVETDKATMEVEAQGDGYLTDVTASEGIDVPVGDVIARISDTAESSAPAAESDPAPASDPSEGDADAGDLPEGKEVIMPTLGMAQDTGLLVKWHKAPGDAVAEDDVLFEVETDKSTVEVNAGADGFLAAVLAEEGEEVPVGQVIAIVSAEAPADPVRRKAAAAPAAPAAPKSETRDTAKAKTPAPDKAAPSKPAPAPNPGGRILASPKLRRLAREQGLDLARLAEAGHPQPYHVKDLEVLKSLPDDTAAGSGLSAPASGHLTAEIATEGFSAFAKWAADNAGIGDTSALLSGLCAASLGRDAVVAVESFGATRTFAASAQLGATDATDEAPHLRLRDLRFSAITSVQVGAEEVPTLTLMRRGTGFGITLEYAQGQLTAVDAITLLSNFAGRMEQPLRHLL